jgi:hypothetical protein
LSFCLAEGRGFLHGHLDDGGVEAIEEFIRSLSRMLFFLLLALGINWSRDGVIAVNFVVKAKQDVECSNYFVCWELSH